jgi:pimeloyl-ACP methyl ester carboxylesterase
MASRYKVGTTSIAVWEEGQGEAVLLVHGFHSSGASLLKALSPLGARARLIAPDLPGFGASDQPAGFLYSLGGLATSLVGLMNLIGAERYAVVGVGVGARVAERVVAKDGRAVVALAVPEPVSLSAWAKRYGSRGARRASRQLQETLDGPYGPLPNSLWPLPTVERALVRVLRTVAPSDAAPRVDPVVDEQAERAHAENLAAREPERRRLRVISQ